MAYKRGKFINGKFIETNKPEDPLINTDDFRSEIGVNLNKPRTIEPTAGNSVLPPSIMPFQREITPISHPAGLIRRGEELLTIDPTTGREVSLAPEFTESARQRVLEEQSGEKRGAFSRMMGRELEERKAEEAERLVGEESAIKGMTGVSKGLGFSSAEIGVIQSVKAASDKRVKSLEKAAKDAVDNFDIREYERVKNEVKEERDAQRTRVNDLWSRFFAQKELESKEKVITTAEEDKRISDIVGAHADELSAISTKPYLTLPSGQRISSDDPNYNVYAAQSGVIKEDQNRTFDKLAAQYGVDRTALEAKFRAQVTETKPMEIKPIEISPGASLIDPTTGEIVATAPSKPPDDKIEVREVGRNLLQYNPEMKKWDIVFTDRLTSGTGVGGGTVDLNNVSIKAKAIYAKPKLLENYTPTEKGKIITELANAGLDMSRFALEKVGVAQRDQIAQYDDIQREAISALSMLDTGLDLGQYASRVGIAGAIIGGSKDFTLYRSSVDNMSSQLLKLRSGAAVTPEEFERIRGFIPQIIDDEKTARTKIERFNIEIRAAQDNYIKRSTQTVQDIVNSAGGTGNKDLNGIWEK